MKKLITAYNELFKASPLPKWACWAITLFCGCYACAVCVLAIMEEVPRPPILTFPFILFAFFFGLFWLWRKASVLQVKGYNEPLIKPYQLTLGLTVVYWGIAVLCGVYTSPDTDWQWAQVEESHFDDWHPVIHTMTIWLFSRIFQSYLFVTLVQCGIFVVLCGWLYKILQMYNYKKWVISVTVGFISLAPTSFLYLRVLWKDTAFALASFALSIIVIHLWHTQGKWLLKPWRVIGFCLLMVLVAFYRHNGVFVVVPFVLLMPFLYAGWRLKLRAIGVGCLVVFALLGYVAVRYALTGENKIIATSRPYQGYTEPLGLPMAMMGQAFVSHADQMPKDARELLLKMGSEEEWKNNWDGTFYQAKFYFGRMAREDGRLNTGEVLYQVPPKEFLSMFVRTCIAVPSSTIRAFLYTTSVVWSPIARDWTSLPRTGKLLNSDLNFVIKCALLPPLGWFFEAPGMHLLLIVIFGGFALIRLGWRASIITIPYLAYMFGSLPLNPGWDPRYYFVLNLCLAPVLCLCLTKPGE